MPTPSSAAARFTTDFIKNRPDVAKRFAAAWGKAVEFINNNPAEARKHLLKNTFTPDDVVDTRADDRLLHGQGPDAPRTRLTSRSSSTSRRRDRRRCRRRSTSTKYLQTF